MGEKLPKYGGFFVEGLQRQPKPSMIRVASNFDPESALRCCQNHTTQRRINYGIIMNRKPFMVRGVWASMCGNCDEVYFAPEVDRQIGETIFRRLHPIEARIVALQNRLP